MIVSVLSLKNVTKHFGMGKMSMDVLSDISVDFEQGKTYAITGVSGTGKSTLLHIIAGLDKPSSGSVWFNNLEVATMNSHEHQYFLNNSVGLMFQQPYLVKELSVVENVMMPALLGGKNEREAKIHASFLLDSVGVGDKAQAKPGSLSGGQQQRVALARALCNRPKFLLADEPTGNLDRQTGYQVVDLLLKLQAEWGMGIIMSTHDPLVAQKMAYQYQIRGGHLYQV